MQAQPDSPSGANVDVAAGREAVGFKPYKGPESYQTEDAALFFGRDRETNRLLSLILSSQVTLLHAQSGAGKTSILNARVMPSLESEGWLPVRVLPHDDPITSARQATLQTAVLHPALEVLALERACSAMFPGGQDPPLTDLLACYDELSIHTPERRSLLSPVDAPPTTFGVPIAGAAKVTPFFCRLLQSIITIERFADFVALYAPENVPAVTGATTVRELIALLESGEVETAHAEFLAELTVPVPGLLPFFRQFFEVYDEHRLDIPLAVIFDQFEELFTRFVDTGSDSDSDSKTEAPDWRLRWKFFDEFRQLYAAEDAGRPLPIRFVFSIREEYLGQLKPLREIVSTLDDHAYRLELLDVDEAQEAIQQPARIYGYEYSDECYDEILRGLVKEERFVEPAHIQIVCDKLWRTFGFQLARQVEGATAEPPAKITLDDIRALEGSGGILKAFFEEFLDSLSEDYCIEALDLLSSLLTGSRTRNIVEKSALIDVRFRATTRREAVLRILENRTIVRVEPRLGGYFCEITHEFLIAPIRDAILRRLNQNPEYRQLQSALRMLAVCMNSEGAILPARAEFELIHEMRDNIKWDRASAEMMLRAAIVNDAPPDAMSRWIVRAREGAEGLSRREALAEQLDERASSGQLLSGMELRVLKKRHFAQRPVLELILRSVICSGTENRDDVAYWTHEYLKHVG